MSDRRWLRRLCLFFRIFRHETPQYLADHLPVPREIQYDIRNARVFDLPASRTARFSSSFFPYCASEWESLSDEIKSSSSLREFKNKLITFIRPPKRSSYGINDIKGLKLLTQLRVEFSDLRSHRFNHNFNCVSPVCICNIEEEDNSHYFLRCPCFNHSRINLFSNISKVIGSDISILPSEHLCNIILYGSNIYNDITNKLILHETLEFIRKSERFKILAVFST